MAAPWEHIDGCGGLVGVGGGEEVEVAGEGGGVAGYVDHAGGRHGLDGGDDIGGQTLSWGVYNDDVGADAGGCKLLCGLAGVGTEKFGVCDVVALGIFFGIGNRRRNHLHADHFTGLARQTQCDRAGSAIQIQRNFVGSKIGIPQGNLIQPLGLGMVDLIERTRRQAKTQAAQFVLDRAVAQQGKNFIAQNRIATFCIDA